MVVVYMIKWGFGAALGRVKRCIRVKLLVYKLNSLLDFILIIYDTLTTDCGR